MLDQVHQQRDSSAFSVSGTDQKPGKLVISSTFTAEPIQEALEFWFAQLGLTFSIAFADYNQVFQQLLDPTSLMAQNQDGVNVILLRVEDWVKFRTSSDDDVAEGANAEEVEASLKRITQDFIDALSNATRQLSVPCVIAFCPMTPGIPAASRDLYIQVEQAIVEVLHAFQSVHLLGSTDTLSRYPVRDYYDASRDRMGHVPYTNVAFAALGTAIARQVYALKRPPCKVIVLDCDNTLWGGVCGEDGALGVSVDGPFKALQEFMVRCSEAGLLLCLCSKNVEEDVWQVFDQRDDMVLSRDRIVAWRINWDPKSENLRSLAAELNLGLDSFIFIDDNPVECSEVQARCPEVLTLQLPDQPEQIPTFLDHVWPFDTLKITAADKQRTQLYKQNRERSQFEQEAANFKTFLEGLQIDIQIVPPSPEQIARVAQLTQRTNQFNATTRRRNELEIQQLCETQGYECWAVTVKDRFGDYGLVGVMVCQLQGDKLEVDTFLLSCRVLGRGVEYRMVAYLGELATQHNAVSVVIPYVRTPKNQPVDKFLSSIGQQYCHTQSSHASYHLPVEFASNLTFQVAESENNQPSPASAKASKPDAANFEQASPMVGANKSDRWNHIALSLTTPEQILTSINQSLRRQRVHTSASHPWVAPRTKLEVVLARIWCEVLRLDQISVHDDFFEVGGTSLLAVGVFTRIEDAFQRRLPITTLLNAPTIEQLAQILEQADSKDVWNPLVPVHETGDRLPLFVVHGGFGDALSIAQIATHLSDDQPFYALRGMGLDGEQLPLESIEVMASKYLEAIKTVSPKGPYRLAGQCSGGIVAFEMAQQLTAQGEEVDFLGLLDTPHPQLENHFNNRYRYYYHRPTYRHGLWDLNYYLFTAIVYVFRKLPYVVQYHYRELMKRDWQGRVGYVKSYLHKPVAMLSRRLGVQKMTTSPKIPVSHQNAANNSLQTGSASHSTDTSSAANQKKSGSSQTNFVLLKDRFFEVFLRAQKRYRPKPYSGKINFFLTTLDTYVPQHYSYSPRSFVLNKNVVKSVSQLLFGWNKLVSSENFVVHPISVEHDQMLDEPYIRTLGKSLEKTLQE